MVTYQDVIMHGMVTCYYCNIFEGKASEVMSHWLTECKQYRELTMNQLENNVLNAAEQIAPNSPVVEAAGAVVATIADPESPSTILADLELAITLVKQFKAKIAGLHPSVINIVKALF